MYELKPCSCPKCGGSGFLTNLNITSGGTTCPACKGQGILYPSGWFAAAPKSDDELARLTQRKEYWKNEATCYRDDVVALQAKLRAVGELRRFNVNIPDGPTGGKIISVVSASELESLFKERAL